MKAIKTVNKNGTFSFELENGDTISKSTKVDYNAFAICIMTDLKGVRKILIQGKTTKGISAVQSAIPSYLPCNSKGIIEQTNSHGSFLQSFIATV